jgi:hypothetical protein
MWPRIAAFGWTVQFIFTVAQAADFHLTAVKFSLADYAKSLVIERSPVSKSIFNTQHREAIIEFKMGNHSAKDSLLIASASTIGPLDDCVIG